MQFMLWYSLLLRTLYLLTAEHSIKSSRLSRLVVSADWWFQPTQERIISYIDNSPTGKNSPIENSPSTIYIEKKQANMH